MGLSAIFDFVGNSLKDALRQGAVIIDIRSPHEYDKGKIRGSLNIAFEQILKNVGYIKKLNKPVVLCGSGFESGAARRILQKHGIKNVYNGGTWERVLKLMNTL